MKKVILFLTLGTLLLQFQRINAQSFNEKAKNPEACGYISNPYLANYIKAAVSLQFLEGFEKNIFPPLHWTSNHNPVKWDTASYVYRSPGKRYARCLYDVNNYQDELLIFPEVNYSNRTAADSVIISFIWRGSKYWSVTPENNCDLRFLVSFDGGNSWDTTLWTEETNPGWQSWVWNTTRLDVSGKVAGKPSVTFAFQYRGQNGAEFDIDQINVNPPFYDVKIENTPHYCSMYPVKQAKGIPIAAKIKNAGQGQLTGIKLLSEISLGAAYYFKDSAALDSLPFGFSKDLFPIIAGFQTNKTGTFNLTYSVTAKEQLGNYADDFVYTFIKVTDSTYAYDNNNASAGIGAKIDSVSSAGQTFLLVNDDTLSSISVFLKSPSPGEEYRVDVYTFTTKPDELVGSSQLITVPSDTSIWYRVPMNKLPLPGGNYFFALSKKDTSNIPLGTCTDHFPGISWVKKDTLWKTVESTGRNVSFLLRLNLLYDAAYIRNGSSTGISGIKTPTATLIYPNPASGLAYINSPDKINDIKVFNTFGQMIYSGIYYGQLIQLDLSGYKTGIYFISVNSGGKISSGKLIIR